MTDLSKIGPFRVKNKKQFQNAKSSFLKNALKNHDWWLFIKYFLLSDNIYVVAYESKNQAKEAWFVYKMNEKTIRILERHKRIWKLWYDPGLITMVDE
jgi:hypothetical protein